MKMYIQTLQLKTQKIPEKLPQNVAFFYQQKFLIED